jgi:hypothetical protein
MFSLKTRNSFYSFKSETFSEKRIGRNLFKIALHHDRFIFTTVVCKLNNQELWLPKPHTSKRPYQINVVNDKTGRIAPYLD